MKILHNSTQQNLSKFCYKHDEYKLSMMKTDIEITHRITHHY